MLAYFLVFPLLPAQADEPETEPTPQTPNASAISLPDPLKLGLGETEAAQSPEVAITRLLGRITYNVLAVIGAVAFLFFMFGGVVWIFSGGNEDRIKKGRDIMLWASLGLAVMFLAYAIVALVFRAFGIQ